MIERPGNKEPERKIEIMRKVGDLIENNVLDREMTNKPVPEELRQVIRGNLIEAGIDVGRLAGKSTDETVIESGVSLHQAEFKSTTAAAMVLVDGVLGRERTDRLLETAFKEIWKNDDGPKMAEDELMVFVGEVMRRMRDKVDQGKEFKFVVSTLAGEDEEKKKAVWRLEAVMTTAYKLLRVVSFDDSAKALSYQEKRFDKFRQRIIKGQVRAKNDLPFLGELKKELYDEEGKDKNVRHLNPGVVGAILEGLVS